MTYTILTLKDGNDKYIEGAKSVLVGIGERFSKSFEFEDCDISPADIVKKAKTAHAVLFGCELPSQTLRKVCNELGLYANARLIGDFMLINDAFGGIYCHEKGFRNNPTFGREAFDTECYSELEIERVARIAYEITPNRHITLADKADELATSKLWRKIVSDINEDYPFVNVDMISIENAISNLAQNQMQDTLLTAHMFSDIVYSLVSSKSNEYKFSALLGDTTLGMYGCTPEASGSASKRDILYAVEFMLRHSFDMQSEADCLKSALQSVKSDGHEATADVVIARL